MLKVESKIANLIDIDNGKGIFHYINEYSPLDIGEVLDIGMLDALLLAKHGQRKLSPLAKSVVGDGQPTSTQMETLGMLLSAYADKWNNLYVIYQEDVSIDSYKMTTHEEEVGESKDKQDTVSNIQSNNKENVSGYDSDTLVTDSESVRDDTDTSTMDVTKDNSRELNRTVTGSQGNRLDDRAKAIQLLDQTYIDILLHDVATELGLLIY